MNQGVYNIISQMIQKGMSLEEIKSNDYLLRHYAVETILNYYLEIQENIKANELREANKPRHMISLRLNDYVFNVIQQAGKNRSKLIIDAIIQCYGISTKENKQNESDTK